MLAKDEKKNASATCCDGEYVAPASLGHFAGTLEAAEEAGMLTAAVALHEKVVPSPLPAEWWIQTSAELDVTSARLCVVIAFSHVRYTASVTERPWWRKLLEMSLGYAKMNAAARLSERATMSFYPAVVSLLISLVN